MTAPVMKYMGVLEDDELTDALQNLHRRSRTGRLDVMGASRKGEIYYVGGQLVHAVSEHDQGENALVILLKQTSGMFQFWATEATSERSIGKFGYSGKLTDHMGLLMWAVQMQDETNVAFDPSNLENSDLFEELNRAVDDPGVQVAVPVPTEVTSVPVNESVMTPSLEQRGPQMVRASGDVEVRVPSSLVDDLLLEDVVPDVLPVSVWQNFQRELMAVVGPVGRIMTVRVARKLKFDVQDVRSVHIPRLSLVPFYSQVLELVDEGDRAECQEKLQPLLEDALGSSL